MRLSLRTHGLLDYGLAAFLLAAPWLFGFARLPHEMGVSVAFGAAIAFLTSITDFKMGLLRFVPFPIHRGADVLSGIMLAGAPLHFSIGGLPGALFVAAGLMQLAAAVLTRDDSKPGGEPIVPGA